MNPFEFLKNYHGTVRINGKKASDEDIDNIEDFTGELEIELIPKSLEEKTKYRIYVRHWMTEEASNLDFHQRWNEGKAMPTREIAGEIIAETPGMLKVKGTCSNGVDWTGFISKAAIIEKEEL